MKNLVLLASAVTGLLVAGCTKPSPLTTGGTPIQVIDWGVIEVAPSTPKHLKLAGKDCTLTATPLADGKFAVLIEGDFGVTGTNSPAGVPLGTSIHTTHNMIVPGNVECLCDVDHKPVRFTLKPKTS
ncbi:MAG TPA: hypothetical protein VNZ22_14800 [Bacillota bacterium]|nr:hypothetical protein [Bacillota bacterium]